MTPFTFRIVTISGDIIMPDDIIFIKKSEENKWDIIVHTQTQEFFLKEGEYRVDRFTVLKDSKNKQIYENDKVRVKYDADKNKTCIEYKGVVVYDYGGFAVREQHGNFCYIIDIPDNHAFYVYGIVPFTPRIQLKPLRQP